MPQRHDNVRDRNDRGIVISRRHALIGTCLAAASTVAFARKPRRHAPKVLPKQFEGWVPQGFGKWKVVAASGVVLPPPDALSDRLYDNLVTRIYESPDDQAVMLLLAYNNLQDGVVQVHRPEICYPVGGYELSQTRPVSVSVGNSHLPGSVFTASAPDRVEQVMYFTRLGTLYPTSWIEQRWAVMRENLEGQVPDGLLMRVSIIEQSQRAALPILETFTQSFIFASPPGLQKLILT